MLAQKLIFIGEIPLDPQFFRSPPEGSSEPRRVSVPKLALQSLQEKWNHRIASDN